MREKGCGCGESIKIIMLRSESEWKMEEVKEEEKERKKGIERGNMRPLLFISFFCMFFKSKVCHGGGLAIVITTTRP